MSLVPHKHQPHCTGESDWPKRPHVVFYNLNHSGASAIVPIISELLTEQFQYRALGDPANSVEFVEQFTCPFQNWVHVPTNRFE
mgnify:CR=1 FL=1